MATLRRLVSRTNTGSHASVGEPGYDFVVEVVARLLETIGVDAPEARSLATAAHHDELQRAATDSSALTTNVR